MAAQLREDLRGTVGLALGREDARRLLSALEGILHVPLEAAREELREEGAYMVLVRRGKGASVLRFPYIALWEAARG